MTTEELTLKFRQYGLPFVIEPWRGRNNEWTSEEFGMWIKNTLDHWDISVCNIYTQFKDKSGGLDECLASLREEILDWQRVVNSWTL